MVQDIFPHIYNNTFGRYEAEDSDIVFFFQGRGGYMKLEGNAVSFPRVAQVEEKLRKKLIYLFRIDKVKYFLLLDFGEGEVPTGFSYENISVLRSCTPKHLVFAGVTAHSLYGWYDSRRFCGRCGHALHPSEKERMLYCPDCGVMEYPKISPAVIIGIINGDRLLLSKYAGGEYTRYALVAGFTEIGETLEETVKREVMEEVGLRVKNIRYYKSQPWGLSSTILAGFFCELDGSEEIHLDENELSQAVWMPREEVPTEDAEFSLTREMMRAFREGCI